MQLCVVSCRFQWSFVAKCGCVRFFVVMCGLVWLCAVVCGCVWLCVVVCGCVRLCVIVCGCVWLCVVACGCVWPSGSGSVFYHGFRPSFYDIVIVAVKYFLGNPRLKSFISFQEKLN